MLKPLTNIIFVDFANLTKGIESLGWILDMERFYIFLTEKYSAEEVFLFTGYLYGRADFYGKLELIGYKMNFKEAVKSGGKIKANCDAEMILEMAVFFYERMSEHQKISIVSGDGDFSCAVRFFQERGVFDRVLSPRKERCSILLKRTAHRIVYIEDFRHILENEKAPSEDGTSQGSFS